MDRRAEERHKEAAADLARAESYRAQAEAEAKRADLHIDNTRCLVDALRTATAKAVAASDTAPGPGGAAALPFREAVERALELAEHEAERALFLVKTNKAQAQADARQAVRRAYLVARGAMCSDAIAEEAAGVFAGIAERVQAAAVKAIDAAERVQDAAAVAYGPDSDGGAFLAGDCGRGALADARHAEISAGVAFAILRDALARVQAMLDSHAARALQHAVDGAADLAEEAEAGVAEATAEMAKPEADGHTTRRALAARAAETVAANLVEDLAGLVEEDAETAPRGTE